MTNREMADRLQSHFPGSPVSARFHNQLELIVEAAQIPAVLATLKSAGFEHLSNITCVDWIEYSRFDVTYNLWSYTHKLHAIVKARVAREHSDGKADEVPTALHIWPQAQVYEREIHEMFGVTFTGNQDLAPLFLHNWHDIPPLRKNFDTVEYSRRAYGKAYGDNGGDRS